MAKPSEPQQQLSSFDNAKLYVWVKALEGKVNNLLREVNVLKNDFIHKNSDLKKEMKILNGDVIEMKHEQEKIIQKIDMIVKELRKTAGIEEVMTLRKYVDFWNPMNFVTQRDLERAIEAKLGGVKAELIDEKSEKK